MPERPTDDTGPPIVLTTDFGLADPYVGVMKGVIYGINPGATVVDLTHQVQPQDLVHAAFVLKSAYRFFPSRSVHVVVVDPGVGTSRRALLLVTPEGRFLGPDNGVLGWVLRDFAGPAGASAPRNAPGEEAMLAVPPGLEAYRLTNRDYWLDPVSNTFHGRDVFAPVAAHLSLGVTPEELGEPVTEIKWLPLPEPSYGESGLDGQIIMIDNFGNLITNVPSAAVSGVEGVRVQVRGLEISGLSRTFNPDPGGKDAGGQHGPNQYGHEAGAPGTGGPLALIGSNGYLEIAVPNASAAQALGVGMGEPVRVVFPRGRR